LFYSQGVKIPDENLTPQQRQHREEQLATIRKMQQLLFPENAGPDGGVGGGMMGPGSGGSPCPPGPGNQQPGMMGPMGGGPGGPPGNQGGMMMMPQQQQQPFHGIKKGKALKRKISGQMMMQPQHHGFEGNGDGNQFMSPNYYYGPPGVNDHRINSSKRSSNNSTNNKIY
jgi:Cdc6-like AAA superfamily ATPase